MLERGEQSGYCFGVSRKGRALRIPKQWPIIDLYRTSLFLEGSIVISVFRVSSLRFSIPLLLVVLAVGCARGNLEQSEARAPSTIAAFDDPDYRTFWREYPEIFEPSKFYFEEDPSETQRFQDDRVVEEALAGRFQRQGLTPSSKTLRTQALFEETALKKLLNESEIERKVQVSEQDLRDYYHSHRSEFHQEEAVEVGHIFMEVPFDATPEQIERTRQRIEVSQKAIASGMSFEEVAERYSEGESARWRGRAGRLRRGQAQEPIEDAVFSLNPGQITPIIQTEYGFHVLKAYQHYPEGILAFAEIRDSIEAMLRKEREETRLVMFLNECLQREDPAAVFHAERLTGATPATVLLQWAGKDFTFSDLKRRAKRRSASPPPPEKWITAWPLLLDREILAREAERLNYRERRDFKKLQNWVSDYLRSLDYLQQRIYSNLQVTEGELQAYYAKHKRRYIQPPLSRSEVFEFRPEVSSQPAQRHRELEKIKRDLRVQFQGVSSIQQFRAIARRLVEQSPKRARFYNTGLIVSPQKGRVYSMAVDKLRPGESSPVLEDQGTLLLIYCIEKRPYRFLLFDEAREQVHNNVLAEKRANAYKNLRANILGGKSPLPD